MTSPSPHQNNAGCGAGGQSAFGYLVHQVMFLSFLQ
jgi:hypothetical protein